MLYSFIYLTAYATHWLRWRCSSLGHEYRRWEREFRQRAETGQEPTLREESRWRDDLDRKLEEAKKREMPPALREAERRYKEFYRLHVRRESNSVRRRFQVRWRRWRNAWA